MKSGIFVVVVLLIAIAAAAKLTPQERAQQVLETRQAHGKEEATLPVQLPKDARVLTAINTRYGIRANSPMSIIHSDKFAQHHSPDSASIITENGSSVAVVWNTVDQDGDYDGVFGKLLVGGAANITDESQINTKWVLIQMPMEVAQSAADAFAYFWANIDSSPAMKLYMQIVDASTAAKRGGEVQLNENIAYNVLGYPYATPYYRGEIVEGVAVVYSFHYGSSGDIVTLQFISTSGAISGPGRIHPDSYVYSIVGLSSSTVVFSTIDLLLPSDQYTRLTSYWTDGTLRTGPISIPDKVGITGLELAPLEGDTFLLVEKTTIVNTTDRVVVLDFFNGDLERIHPRVFIPAPGTTIVGVKGCSTPSRSQVVLLYYGVIIGGDGSYGSWAMLIDSAGTPLSEWTQIMPFVGMFLLADSTVHPISFVSETEFIATWSWYTNATEEASNTYSQSFVISPL